MYTHAYYTCTTRTHTCTHTHIHAAHTLVWSVGHHGPTNILVDKLNPMLLKYKVAAYFSGHDHDMQHINDSGVQYLLSGAGHLVESSQKHMVSTKIKVSFVLCVFVDRPV